jgi:hypothetical protein
MVAGDLDRGYVAPSDLATPALAAHVSTLDKPLQPNRPNEILLKQIIHTLVLLQLSLFSNSPVLSSLRDLPKPVFRPTRKSARSN